MTVSVPIQAMAKDVAVAVAERAFAAAGNHHYEPHIDAFTKDEQNVTWLHVRVNGKPFIHVDLDAAVNRAKGDVKTNAP